MKLMKSARWKDIPEEAVVELLSWLSVEDAKRFGFVCKSWLYLLLNDPYFKKLHLFRSQFVPTIMNNHIPNPTLLVLRNQKNLEKTHFYLTTGNACEHIEFIQCESKTLPNKHYQVEGICNGLILLSDSSQLLSSKLWLWNPFTKDSISIICPPIPSDLPQNPKWDRYRFGYDEVNDEYKVMRTLLPYFEHPSSPSCYLESRYFVNTIGTDSWRTVEGIAYTIGTDSCRIVEGIFNRLEDSSATTVVINGNPHWMAKKRALEDASNLQIIYAFNIRDEKFYEIPHPTSISHGLVAKLGELLAGFQPSPEEAVIWIMQEYGVSSSWTKAYKFGVYLLNSPITSFLSARFNPQELLCLTGDGKILIRNGLNYFQYSPQNTLCTFVTNYGLEPSDVPHFYEGSLISPSDINKIRDIEEAENITVSDHIGSNSRATAGEGTSVKRETV